VSTRLQRRGRSGFAPDSLYADPGRLPGSATNTCLYRRAYDSPLAAVKPLAGQGSGVRHNQLIEQRGQALGRWVEPNIVPACQACNGAKSDRSPLDFFVPRGSDRELRSPRAQDFSEKRVLRNALALLRD
jgi:hypothetical protein